ncbi:MAG TPA: MFS transporter [Candidatus Paceibacterota bacterium]|nr:MFS transporter [Candidatus Paceibacterota bacterium]
MEETITASAVPEASGGAPSGETSAFRKWGPLAVLSLALAIIIIDTTVLNVSLSTIIEEFGTTIQSLQWVITLYSLILTAFTITGGRLGDLFGRRRMFVVGAVIFAVGSFITSISHGVGVMILGEAVVEGLGAALMMPATASLLLTNYKGRDRSTAFGVWGGVAGASSAIGPILGGYFTSNFSWRWAFRINVFVVIAVVIGSFLIKEARDTEHRPSLDWIGIILSSLGLLLIVFGVIESSTYGWWIASAPFALGSRTFTFFHNLSITVLAIDWGVVFLALFILWELRVTAKGKLPLVSMKLFENKQFTSGAVTMMVIFLGQSGMFFTMPIFFQAVRGLDALHTGLSLLPLSLAVLVAAPLSGGVFARRFTPKRIAQAGILIDIVAFLVLFWTISISSSVWTLLPGLSLFGIGMGLLMAQLSNITLSAVRTEEAGEASGVNNTFRQLGGTLGTAIIGAILLSTLASGVSNGVAKSAVIPADMKPQISAALAEQSGSIEFGGASGLEGRLPANVSAEVSTIVKQATVDGNKDAFLYAALFAALSFLVSFLLPNKKNIEHPEEAAAAAPADH